MGINTFDPMVLKQILQGLLQLHDIERRSPGNLKPIGDIPCMKVSISFDLDIGKPSFDHP